MTRKRVYFFVGVLCLVGYIRLIGHVSCGWSHVVTGCLFHRVTGVPCPSCGSTRSVLFLLKGDFLSALHANPLGYVVFLPMVVFPLWILFDLICGKDGFWRLYQSAEAVLRIKYVWMVVLVLIVTNWIWNIYKYT
ncbi:MAG: DUF2752 domain-containing protein [Dysgonamonadaceae bacterium]|nr:DUF2752 domain-containing protein [Dysgonamonadaceae bacterium]